MFVVKPAVAPKGLSARVNIAQKPQLRVKLSAQARPASKGAVAFFDFLKKKDDEDEAPAKPTRVSRTLLEGSMRPTCLRSAFALRPDDGVVRISCFWPL